MTNKKIYLTTGEFAKICLTTKDTLIYYDKIGIFSPAMIKDNGYRYYSIDQTDAFNVIAILKELDVPLLEMKNYIDNKSKESTVNFLLEKEKEIDKKIKHLQKNKKVISEKAKNIQTSLNRNFEQVYIENMKKEYLILSEKLIEYDEMTVVKKISKLIESSNKSDYYYYYNIGGIRCKDDILNESFEKYTYFYLKSIDKIKNCQHIKEEGRYIVIYHYGHFDTTHISYDKILEYAQQNNIKICDNFYEENIVDHIAVCDYSEYIIKIMVKIKL